MANQDVFPTNSRTENFLVIISTISGHDRKYFWFFKNIKTRNLDMFFDQFDNAEFIWRYFQLPVMTSGHVRSLPVCREHLKSMTSTLFLSNSSTLNTMKIFSTSGHGQVLLVSLKPSKNFLISLIRYNGKCVTNEFKPASYQQLTYIILKYFILTNLIKFTD